MDKWFTSAVMLCCCFLTNGILHPQSIEGQHRVQHYFTPSRDLLYLQTDKSIYESGEDLWFKAYALDVQTLSLSDKSQTLYVEMTDGKDSIVWQEKYPMQSGIAEGHIYVDKTLAEGGYRIHAYTRYSFLGDTLQPVYPKHIQIVNSIGQQEITGGTTTQKHDALRLSFFPEGGCLTDGVASKVAFKASDGRGMPVEVKGMLLEDGKDIARLESLHDGMGFFFITPRKEAAYKVILSDGREYPFVEVYGSGLSLHLHKQTTEYLEFYISQSDKRVPPARHCVIHPLRRTDAAGGRTLGLRQSG